MKRALILAVLLGFAGLTVGQAPTRVFPDVTTPQTNASIALFSYKGQVEAYLIQDGTDIQNLQQTVGDSKIGNAALDTRLKALENPQPAPQPQPQVQTLKLIDPVNLPLGALSGVVDGIGWPAGQWQAMADGVAPVAQGSRSFLLPANTTLVSLTVTCSVLCQFTLKDNTNGFTWTSPVVQPGSGIQAQVSWTAHSGPIGLTMASGAAINVRLTQVQYQ